MPQISKQKKDKILEQILYYLFSISPKSAYTNAIANEIARDEEFTKSLLAELSKKSFIAEVNKGPDGQPYLRRQRWRLSETAFKAYSSNLSSNSHKFL